MAPEQSPTKRKPTPGAKTRPAGRSEPDGDLVEAGDAPDAADDILRRLRRTAPFDPARRDWRGTGKVRARQDATGLYLSVHGITTQARYYKPLLYEFFRKEAPFLRPRYGDCWCVLRLEHLGEAPHLDLDNLAKALLDAIKRFVMHDDSQVSLLLVERRRVDAEYGAERICLGLGFFAPDGQF